MVNKLFTSQTQGVVFMASALQLRPDRPTIESLTIENQALRSDNQRLNNDNAELRDRIQKLDQSFEERAARITKIAVEAALNEANRLHQRDLQVANDTIIEAQKTIKEQTALIKTLLSERAQANGPQNPVNNEVSEADQEPLSQNQQPQPNILNLSSASPDVEHGSIIEGIKERFFRIWVGIENCLRGDRD